MQVVQGRSNGYPVPRSIAEPPCPGGYKYGGLALRVGGWTTGRQPVAVKKLTVRKHKLWPRNRWIGIDLGSGKRLMRWGWQLGMCTCVQTGINNCRITVREERLNTRCD